MRAKITLKKGRSFKGKGLTFVLGTPKIITDVDIINYYQHQGGFDVTILEPVSTPNPNYTPKAIDVVSDKKEPVVETVEQNETIEEIESDVESFKYTEDYLSELKKREVMEIADELGLDAIGPKKTLIKRILEAQ